MIKYLFKFNFILLLKIVIYEIYYLTDNFNFHYIKSNNKKYFDHIPSPYYYLSLIYEDLNKLKFKNETFVDLGSGTGRVLNFFHKRGFKKLIGVEQSKKAIEIFYKENKNKNLKILNKDILKYNFPNNTGIIYLYNPAPKHIIVKLVNKIKKKKFKNLKIIYLSPDYINLFDKKYFIIVKKAYDEKLRGYAILKKKG